jgi:large subunit ribosomal protein L23
MELTAYEIIKKLVATTKSVKLHKLQGKVTLEVVRDANKLVIRKAVEQIWNVKVDAINVATRPGKRRSFGRREFCSSPTKRAIVTLKPGYTIDMPGQESMGAGGN